MKDEIKETLDFIKEQIKRETLSYEPDVELSKEEAKLLLDYITNLYNLQQENKQLKEDKKKAIECINYYAIEDDDFNKLYNVEEQELLAILGDKE